MNMKNLLFISILLTTYRTSQGIETIGSETKNLLPRHVASSFVRHDEQQTHRLSTVHEHNTQSIIRGGSTDSIATDVELGNECIKCDSALDDDDRWRLDLPEQLQNRRGSLHRILIPRAKIGDKHCKKEETICLYLLGK